MTRLTNHGPQKHHTAAEQYWADAYKFVARHTTDPQFPAWYTLVRGTAETAAWAGYFRRRGFTPNGMKLLDDHGINSFLVPTQFPEEFDGKA